MLFGLGFLSIFFFFFGIGALLGLAYVFIRYGIPLIGLIFQTIFLFFKTVFSAFAEGWKEAGDGK